MAIFRKGVRDRARHKPSSNLPEAVGRRCHFSPHEYSGEDNAIGIASFSRAFGKGGFVSLKSTLTDCGSTQPCPAEHHRPRKGVATHGTHDQVHYLLLKEAQRLGVRFTSHSTGVLQRGRKIFLYEDVAGATGRRGRVVPRIIPEVRPLDAGEFLPRPAVVLFERRALA